MKVLLISRGNHKPSHLQALGNLADHEMSAAASHCHDVELADREHNACVQEILAVLQDLGVEVCTHRIESNGSCPTEHFDLVLAVGGDGTVLYANHALNDSRSLIVGVRSSHSSVGHLCAYDYRRVGLLATALQQSLPHWNRGQGGNGGQAESGEKEERHATADQNSTDCLSGGKSIALQRMQALITSNSGQQSNTSAVLNDFLFANSNPAATTRYLLNFQERWEVHKSSGIWIATAAGSSAALRAAGGKAMAITAKSLQFLVRELYQPLTSSMSGAEFDCDRDIFQIVSLCDAAVLSLDGQYRLININYGDTISFRLASSLRIVLSC